LDLQLMLPICQFLAGNLKLFGPNHCREPTFRFHCWVLQRPEPFIIKTTSRSVQLCLESIISLNNWMKWLLYFVVVRS
jgi:hypothetical protein